MSKGGQLFIASVIIILLAALSACASRPEAISPTATSDVSPTAILAETAAPTPTTIATVAPSATPTTRTAAPTATTTATIAPSATPTTRTDVQKPTPTIPIPPRPTVIPTINVNSPEKRDFMGLNPLEWYKDPGCYNEKRVSFVAYVHEVQEAEDQAGRYMIVIGYPDTSRGIYPLPWLIYFSEPISVSHGLWLEVFGKMTDRITSTDALGHTFMIPLIAASGYITYTERPYEYCIPCEQKE